ncbi:MAG: type II toxin-antitoxin system MqsA family antitoxin [Anaerolineaceae bacterium]|nr:type II toxin-antitoxin system MqsA family antitoxin [Anaerolineaceae bacterium]
MTCAICNQGETRPGTTTMTLERDNSTLVVKQVPAQVCENCGEAWLDDETVAHLEALLDTMVKNGTEVALQQYAIA